MGAEIVPARLANALDLRLEMPTASTPRFGEMINSPTLCCTTFIDGGQTIATLGGMGWAKSPVYGSVIVPDDAHSFVQSYLEAGTGPEAISSKMPLLIWLVFMQYVGSKTMQDAISRTASGSGAMKAMFADDWCREILLKYMPEMSERREADSVPDDQIMLLPNGKGIEAHGFVIMCLHSMITNHAINADTFQGGYGSLSDLLIRWGGVTHDKFTDLAKVVSRGTGGSIDQLVRDTLFQIVSHWGKQTKEGGTINRRFAKQMFRAMGGLVRRDD